MLLFTPLGGIELTPNGFRLLESLLPVTAHLHPTGDTDVGRHEVEWNGRDARGESVGSGTYLVRLRVNEFVEAERLVLLR